MPFPEWTPPKVSDEPKEPGWGPAGDLRRSMGVLNQPPLTPQEQRIAELEAALRALIAVDRAPDEECHYCGAWVGSLTERREFDSPDCPWVTAKALLSPEG